MKYVQAYRVTILAIGAGLVLGQMFRSAGKIRVLRRAQEVNACKGLLALAPTSQDTLRVLLHVPGIETSASCYRILTRDSL